MQLHASKHQAEAMAAHFCNLGGETAYLVRIYPGSGSCWVLVYYVGAHAAGISMFPYMPITWQPHHTAVHPQTAHMNESCCSLASLPPLRACVQV